MVVHDWLRRAEVDWRGISYSLLVVGFYGIVVPPSPEGFGGQRVFGFCGVLGEVEFRFSFSHKAKTGSGLGLSRVRRRRGTS